MSLNLTSLMTADEVILALRMDELGNPAAALAHLRRTRRIPFVRIGKRLLYRREDVNALIEASLVETGAKR